MRIIVFLLMLLFVITGTTVEAKRFEPRELPERTAPVEVWDDADKKSDRWGDCVADYVNSPKKSRMFKQSWGWYQTREIIAYIIAKDCDNHTKRLVLAWKKVGYTPDEVESWFRDYVDDLATVLEDVYSGYR